MVAQCGQPVVATYGFEQVAEAVAKAGESGGKVLFTPAGLPR
jgi:predicted enzyme related to lactoylglutathione lyase